MDKTFVFWLSTFLLGIVAWTVLNLDRGNNNYDLFPNLINKTSGQRIDLREIGSLIDMIDESQALINSTDSEERLFKLIYMSHIMNPLNLELIYSSDEEKAVSGWPVANQNLCGRHLDNIISLLNTKPDFYHIKGKFGKEFTRFMDSYGRPGDGLYDGKNSWMGSYSACVRSVFEDGNLKNRYCLAKFKFRSWPNNTYEFPPATIKVGICLPETCDSNSFETDNKAKIEFMSKYHMKDSLKSELIFHSLACLPDDRSPIRQIPLIGRLTIIAVIAWFIMIIVISIVYEKVYHPIYKKHFVSKESEESSLAAKGSNGNHRSIENSKLEISLHKQKLELVESEKKPFFVYLLDGLTLRHALKNFKNTTFRVRYDKGERVRVDLNSLDFLKSLFAIVVVVAHSHMFVAMLSKSLRGRIELSNTDTTRLLFATGRMIDTFFIFFGILTAYTLLRKLSLEQLSNPFVWILTNVGVYLRIVPVFVLTYLVNRTVIPYLGSGPWWDYGTNGLTTVGRCMHESWLRIIPPLGGLGTPSVPTCNLPAWFLVSYTQITLFLPLLTYLLYKLPHMSLRIALVLFLSLASGFDVAYRLVVQKVVSSEAFTIYGPYSIVLMEKYESSGYMDTLGRLGSVAVGCLIGYLLHMYRLERIRKWPAWLTSRPLVYVQLFLHFIMIILPIIGNLIYLYTRQIVPVTQFVVANSLLLIIWPYMNAHIIINMTTVYSKHVFVRMMSHPFWHAFNKLGLSILLVQYEIILFAITVFEDAPSNGFLVDTFKVASLTLIGSIISAFILYIFVESPVTHLTMIVFSPLMKGNSSRRHESDLETVKEPKLVLQPIERSQGTPDV